MKYFHPNRYGNFTFCKSFDHSVDTGSRHYEKDQTGYIRRVYDPIANPLSVVVNNSCIGESPGRIDQGRIDPGRIDQCNFNGYLTYDELCNPCEKEEFKNECEELCETTTGLPFGPYKLM